MEYRESECMPFVQTLVCRELECYVDDLQHTATHCNTLQHTAAHCNTLQHTAAHCNTLYSDILLP